MKIRVTMKDPDALYECINDAVREVFEARMELDDDERDQLRDLHEKRARDVAAQWFKYGEYLTVEIDTDAKTCVVVEPSA